MTVKELNAKVDLLEARIDDMAKFYNETSKESADLVESVINDNKLLVKAAKEMFASFERLQKEMTMFAIVSALIMLIILFV